MNVSDALCHCKVARNYEDAGDLQLRDSFSEFHGEEELL